MTYQDKTFEIDDVQIKFKNTSIVTFFIIFVSILGPSLFLYKCDLLHLAGSITGFIIGCFLIRKLINPYFKNTIQLLDVEYVKAQIWDKNIDKKRNFWGAGKYKYHFPTGINKKTNSKVLFVHTKGRKAAVGFVPENYEKAISVIRERGIKIIENTDKK